MVAALVVVVREDRASYDGEVGVRADEVVGKKVNEVEQVLEGVAVDVHRAVPRAHGDAVLIEVRIGGVLQTPTLADELDGDDAQVLARGVRATCSRRGAARVALVLYAELAGRVLFPVGGAGTAGAREVEEGVDVAGLERCPATVDEVVLVPVVDAAQHGTIAELAAHGRDLAVELGAVHLAQARATELGGDGLHLTGDGGVVVGGRGVVGPHLDEDERVSVVLEVEPKLLRLGLVGIPEVHERQTPQAHGSLVHEAAGLAIVVVLGALAHLGERHRARGLGSP